MSDARCIWLTREQRDALFAWFLDVDVTESYKSLEALAGSVLAQWDAAPPDATEAVGQAITTILHERPYCAPEHVVAAVLAALNHPGCEVPE